MCIEIFGLREDQIERAGDKLCGAGGYDLRLGREASMSDWLWREAQKRARENHPLMKDTRKNLSRNLFRAMGASMVGMPSCETCADWEKKCEGPMGEGDCWYAPGTIRVIEEREA